MTDMMANDEDRIRAWLENNSVKNDGFDINEDSIYVMSDLDRDLGYISGYGDNATIKDLLLHIIDNEDEEPYEYLWEISDFYRFWSLKPYLAAYWAHMAVVLCKKAMPSEDEEGYWEMMENLSISYEKLGDAFFSVDYDWVHRTFPKFDLAAKSYEAAEETDLYKSDHNIIQLGKSYLGRERVEFGYHNIQKAWDTFREKKYYAWMGQITFIKKQVSQAMLYWDQDIEECRYGWGEYFKGRYLWSQKKYSEAIELWKQGEAKNNAECSGELFNWIVGHPTTSETLKKEQVSKIIKLQWQDKCVSGYKYMYKHIKNGNIKFNKVNIIGYDGDIIEYTLYNAEFYLNKGVKYFCPYCLRELKKLGSSIDDTDYENAMRGWGYDGLDF